MSDEVVTALDDLVTFARIEQEAHDIEPWAEVLGALDLDIEPRLWLVSLYNAYDDLGSAWRVFERWPSPQAWQRADDARDAGSPDYPLSRERRGLRGGRVVQRLDSYASLVGGSQAGWLARAGDPILYPHRYFEGMTEHLRAVWGVGRQSAFEWAEFLAKSCGWPLVAGDAQLWESSGPRHSLEAIHEYPHGDADATWLDAVASGTRQHLADAGVHLSWEDFETVICDFHVMRKGRYFPGKHLRSLREEIAGVPALEAAFTTVTPWPWCTVEPGTDKTLERQYLDTGVMVTEP